MIADRAIRSTADLAARADVHGDIPAAVVAIRGAERLSRSEIRVFASLYDPATRRWRGTSAVLRSEGSATLPKPAYRTSRVVTWADAPMFDA